MSGRVGVVSSITLARVGDADRNPGPPRVNFSQPTNTKTLLLRLVLLLFYGLVACRALGLNKAQRDSANETSQSQDEETGSRVFVCVCVAVQDNPREGTLA